MVRGPNHENPFGPTKCTCRADPRRLESRSTRKLRAWVLCCRSDERNSRTKSDPFLSEKRSLTRRIMSERTTKVLWNGLLAQTSCNRGNVVIKQSSRDCPIWTRHLGSQTTRPTCELFLMALRIPLGSTQSSIT